MFDGPPLEFVFSRAVPLGENSEVEGVRRTLKVLLEQWDCSVLGRRCRASRRMHYRETVMLARVNDYGSSPEISPDAVSFG
jgi:hypothetical protein